MARSAAKVSEHQEPQDGAQSTEAAPQRRLIGLPGGEGAPAASTPELQPAVDKLVRLLTLAAMASVPVDGLTTRARTLKARFDGLTVVDRPSFEAACMAGVEAKALQADAEGSALDELKNLAHLVHKELTSLLGRLTKDPKSIEDGAKKQLVAFCRAEAEEHRLRELERHAAAVEAAKSRRQREVEALRRAERFQEADRLEATSVRVPFMPEPFATDPVPGVSITVAGYKAVVTDETLVPADFRRQIVDLAALEAAAAATGFTASIPGVEFVPEYRVAMSGR